MFAVVISGSAFANPGNPDKGPKKDPQASIEAYNVCKVQDIYNGDTYAYDPTLVVKTRVKNTSGDTPVDAELSKIAVQGTQKARGKSMNLGGDNTTVFYAVRLLDNYDDFVTVNKEYIDICSNLADKNKHLDTSLNAEVTLTIDNSRKVTFSSMCDDNPYTHCYDADGYPMYCEEKDESIVEVPAGTCQ